MVFLRESGARINGICCWAVIKTELKSDSVYS